MSISPISFKAPTISRSNQFQSNVINGNETSSEQNKQDKSKYLLGAAGVITTAAGIAIIAKCIKTGNAAKAIEKPKFLYHITNIDNYQSMLQDGFIKKSSPLLGDGIFFSNIADLKNKYPKHVMEGMINWYGNASNNHKLVVLRLPVTAEREKLIDWRQISLLAEGLSNLDLTWRKMEDFCSKELKDLHKKPLEFLYKNELSVDEVQKVAEVDLTMLSKNNLVADFWKTVNRTLE